MAKRVSGAPMPRVGPERPSVEFAGREEGKAARWRGVGTGVGIVTMLAGLGLGNCGANATGGGEAG